MPKQIRKPGIHLHKTTVPHKDGYKTTYTQEYYWILIAKNGKTIARSSETYKRKGSAVRSILVAAGIFLGGKPYELIPYYDHRQPRSPVKYC